MPFSWPTVGQITYRLRRLWRLIAFGTLLPLVFFTHMWLVGLGPSPAVMVIPVFILVVAHTVLFPNSSQETAAVSLTLTGLALVFPLISGSFFGWFLFLVFAIWVLMSGQQRVLDWQMSSAPHNPVFKARVKVNASLEEARRWFPLRPGLKRGPYTCGDTNDAGRFPVWYDTGAADWMSSIGLEGADDEATADDSAPDEAWASFYALIEVDEPDVQRTQVLEGDDPDALQTVVEHRFKAHGKGCVVTETDAAVQFPRGQSLFMWLSDFQKDGLLYNRDLLEERPTRTNHGAHHMSLLTLLGAWFMRRQTQKVADFDIEEMDAGEQPDPSPDLAALLARLGPDFETNGFTKGPMPLITLEEFFYGNDDDGSFQGADLRTARRGLRAMRDREGVAELRLGITQWEGHGSWPLAEYVYLVTTASAEDVADWFKDAKIWVDEVNTGNEHHARDDLAVPPGHRIVWAWID